MEMTFPSNVHFRAKLVSSPTAQGVKKKKKKFWLSEISFHYIFFPPLSLALPLTHFLFVWVTLAFSPALPLSLSWPTCAFSAAIYYPLHILLPRSPAIWTLVHPLVPPCVSHHHSLHHLLTLILTSHRTPYFLVSLHLRSAFPYLRFIPWLADKYHFGGPPHVADFSFPDWNGFSAYLHCQWSYRTFPAYSVDPIFSTDKVKEEGLLWEWGSINCMQLIQFVVVLHWDYASALRTLHDIRPAVFTVYLTLIGL